MNIYNYRWTNFNRWHFAEKNAEIIFTLNVSEYGSIIKCTPETNSRVPCVEPIWVFYQVSFLGQKVLEDMRKDEHEFNFKHELHPVKCSGCGIKYSIIKNTLWINNTVNNRTPVPLPAMLQCKHLWALLWYICAYLTY